jgi:AraC-like DNA-binding protein
MGATLIVPFRGSLTAEVGQRTFSAGSGGALLFSPNTRRTRVNSPAETTFFGIPIILPTRELHSAADRIGVLAGFKAPKFDFAVEMDSFRGRSARELIQVVRLIVSEVERGAVRMQRPDAQVSWLELLSEKTIEVLAEADVVRTPGDLGSRPAYRHVRRAMEYMNEHFADVTTTADIARECGISVRALEQAFSTVLGDSPHSVLSAIRLDEARRLLLARAGEVSVTEVALACGLSHPGRFAAAYRRRFGEPPSALTRGRT